MLFHPHTSKTPLQLCIGRVRDSIFLILNLKNGIRPIANTHMAIAVHKGCLILLQLIYYVGALDEGWGSPCPVLILRNGNVACPLIFFDVPCQIYEMVMSLVVIF